MKPPFCILADLGLERSPNAERGLVVLALIACLLGTISTLRWWLGPPPQHAATDDGQHGWPFMKRTLRGVGQVASGALAVFVLSRLVTPSPEQPKGWSLISPPHEVYSLELQGDVVWAGGKEGLFAVNRATGTLAETPLRSRDLRGVKALRAEDDGLWIGCTAGLFHWQNSKLQKLTPPSLTDLGPISAIKRTRDGALWVGALKGVWRIANSHWEWFGEAEGLRLPTVDTIFEDCKGAIWFASKEPEAPGLWRRAEGRWTLLDQKCGLHHAAINDMIEDHRGVLWMACGFGAAGLTQPIINGVIQPATTVSGLDGRKIRSLFEDSAGRLWFCSEYNGVAIKDGDSWRRITMKEGLPGNEIKVMREDDNGTLWLGNERGLGRINGYK